MSRAARPSLELRRAESRTDRGTVPRPFGGVVPLLAFGAIVWLLTSLTADEWKALLVVVAVAVVVYFASLPSRRAATRHALRRSPA